MKNLLLYLLIVILISACSTTSPASDQSEITITGTKISKEAIENNSPVIVVKPGEGGATTLQDLLNQIADTPFEEGATCSEAIKSIQSKGYTIVSIEKNLVVATTPTNSTVKVSYNFQSSDCPADAYFISAYHPIQINNFSNLWSVVKIGYDLSEEFLMAFIDDSDNASYVIRIFDDQNSNPEDKWPDISDIELFGFMVQSMLGRSEGGEIIQTKEVVLHDLPFQQYDLLMTNKKTSSQMLVSSYYYKNENKIISLKWAYPCEEVTTCKVPEKIQLLDKKIEIYGK